MTTSKKVDWEALAKNLQKALEAEIDANEALEKENNFLKRKLFAVLEECIKKDGVIEYLEKYLEEEEDEDS